MKARLLAISAFAVLLSGCGVYGSGEAVGYVYAVDDGLFRDKAWYKSNLESSESDCYTIGNEEIKAKLRSIASGTKVKLTYERHFLLLFTGCGEQNTGDIITGVETL